MPESDYHITVVQTFSPIECDTMQESAYQQLRDALMSGRLQPGQRISIRSLAAAMDTSPMPVREALRRLEAQNALVMCPGRSLGVPEMTGAELLELRDIRVTLEGLAAEKAAERVTSEEMEKISWICAEIDEATRENDCPRFLETNRAFHFSIYRSAQLDLLMSIIETLWLRIGPFLNLFVKDQRHLENSMIHHWRAEQALRARDGAAARAAIVADISEAAEDLMRYVSDAAAGTTGLGTDEKQGRLTQ